VRLIVHTRKLLFAAASTLGLHASLFPAHLSLSTTSLQEEQDDGMGGSAPKNEARVELAFKSASGGEASRGAADVRQARLKSVLVGANGEGCDRCRCGVTTHIVRAPPAPVPMMAYRLILCKRG
jgi:hypothetical protein